MTHSNPSAFNVSPFSASAVCSQVFLPGGRVFRLFRLHVLAVLSLFLLACGGGSFEEEVFYNLDNIAHLWTKVTENADFSKRYLHASTVFDDGSGDALWVIGGTDGSNRLNDVWKSSDGKTWIPVTSAAGFTPRYGHTVAVFNNALWVIGGYSEPSSRSDVWKSSDGKTWTQVTSAAGFPAREGHTVSVFDDGGGAALWVIGGYSGPSRNDVWKSSDGKTWTQVTSAAGFSPRYGHTVAVFDNALWLTGGIDGVFRNDVWKSSDGKTWTQVTLAAGAGFSARYGHTIAVFDDGSGDALWLTGGTDGSNKNDVWKSPDGKTWTQVTPFAGFSARHLHTSTVFDDGSGDALWVIGGTDGSNRLNDVWKYP